jgi:hypothetical protein
MKQVNVDFNMEILRWNQHKSVKSVKSIFEKISTDVSQINEMENSFHVQIRPPHSVKLPVTSFPYPKNDPLYRFSDHMSLQSGRRIHGFMPFQLE